MVSHPIDYDTFFRYKEHVNKYRLSVHSNIFSHLSGGKTSMISFFENVTLYNEEGITWENIFEGFSDDVFSGINPITKREIFTSELSEEMLAKSSKAVVNLACEFGRDDVLDYHYNNGEIVPDLDQGYYPNSLATGRVSNIALHDNFIFRFEEGMFDCVAAYNQVDSLKFMELTSNASPSQLGIDAAAKFGHIETLQLCFDNSWGLPTKGCKMTNEVKLWMFDKNCNKIKKCTICGESSKMQCGACKVSWYCSKECQKEDWKVHKKLCSKFKIGAVST
jgi:hypothetical protein